MIALTNPFTLTFGMEPKEYITRTTQIDMIVNTFSDEVPSSFMYMLSGVRGAGKTVMLSSITETFEKKKDWIVIKSI